MSCCRANLLKGSARTLTQGVAARSGRSAGRSGTALLHISGCRPGFRRRYRQPAVTTVTSNVTTRFRSTLSASDDGAVDTEVEAVSEPLRILFCGSDEYSCESLRALVKEKAENPALIRSIHVVTRPPKMTGRLLNVLREVPLMKLASELELPIHPLDTFTGWTPPEVDGQPFNLIIAVSFGLFIPKRILSATKYGGLNLHPSLLPDLPGAAPLHWTILLNYSHTGVTLQTLDEDRFDRGLILSQRGDIPVPENCRPAELSAHLAPLSASVLIDGLRRGLHVLRKPVSSNSSSGPCTHARKINKGDSEMRWDLLESGEWTAADVARRSRLFGSVWSVATSQGHHNKKVPKLPKRCQLFGITAFPTRPPRRVAVDDSLELATVYWSRDGCPPRRDNYYTTCWVPDEDKRAALLLTGDGNRDIILRVETMKLAGGNEEKPAWTVLSTLARLAEHDRNIGRKNMVAEA